MIFEIHELSSLPEVVTEFIAAIGSRKHFAIFGPMGVGKTTFIKEVCKQLRVKEVVTSPTFSLVNEYTTGDSMKVYHFDFYRIKSEIELYDLGYEDYVYSDSWCFIEWPEKAPNLIPSHFQKIIFRELELGKREMKMEPME